MITIRPQDIVLRVGGRAMARGGAISRRLSKAHDTYREQFTRAGTGWVKTRTGMIVPCGTDVPRLEWLDLDADGVLETPVWLTEKIRTNYATRAVNQGGSLTGWSVGGGGATPATLTAVNSSVQLALGGLPKLVTDGYVLELDNTAGDAVAYAWNSGGAALADTTPHSLAVWVRGGPGALLWSNTEVGAKAFANSLTFTRELAENLTPANTASQFRVRADVGALVYFILAQVEKGRTATSDIPNATAGTVSRPAETGYVTLPPAVRAPTAFALYMECIDHGVAQDSSTNLVNIGLSNPVISVYAPGNVFRGRFQAGTDDVYSSVATAATVRDRLQFLLTMTDDGRIQFHQKKNGGGVESGAQSAPAGDGSPWGGGRRITFTNGSVKWIDAVIAAGDWSGASGSDLMAAFEALPAT